MKRIGIIAALPAELKPLVRQWPRTDQVFIGQIGNAECFAAAEGMGGAAATRSFAAVREAAGVLDTVISYGWAGALTEAVTAPDIYTVAEVVDARTGERFATDSRQTGPMAPLRLVTLDHVARADEKEALALRYQAELVDMEAATIGRLARAHGLRFECVRGISDNAGDRLPDLNRFINPAGQMRMGAFVLHALLRPGAWSPLMELGRNSREAAESLASAMPYVLGQVKLIS